MEYVIFFGPLMHFSNNNCVFSLVCERNLPDGEESKKKLASINAKSYVFLKRSVPIDQITGMIGE